MITGLQTDSPPATVSSPEAEQTTSEASPIPEYGVIRWLEMLEKATGIPLAFFNDNGARLGCTESFDFEALPIAPTPGSDAEVIRHTEPRVLRYQHLAEYPGTLVAAMNAEHQRDFLPVLARMLDTLIQLHLDHEVEISSLSQEIVDRYEEVNVLYDLSETLGSIFDDNKVLTIVIERAMAILKSKLAGIYLAKPAAGTLELVCAVPDEIWRQNDGFVRDAERLSHISSETEQFILVEKSEDIDELIPRTAAAAGGVMQDQPVFRMMIAPLFVEKIRIGVMVLARDPGDRFFTNGEKRLMTAICSMAAVALYHNQLVEKSKREEIARHELQLASQIQENLLPQAPPSLAGLEIASGYMAANKVGGDYIDYLVDRHGNLHLVIADVSGHNIGAAIVMAVTRTAIRMSIDKDQNPASVLQETNRVMFDDLERSQLFVSACASCYDPRTRTLRIASAGHNPVLLWHGQEQQAEWFESSSFFIGLEPELTLEMATRTLKTNDVFVLYTDGLVEATNLAGQRYQEERLAQIVEKSAHLPANQIVSSITMDMKQFIQHGRNEDDISIVVMKVLSRSE